MKTIRLVLALIVLLALGAGYAASQLAYFQGRAAEYAASVDTPLVQGLALLLLLGTVILAFVPDREGSQDS